MPNTQFIEDHKQENLEIVLDHLCKATGRDITIFYPTKANEIVPYLIKEIKLAIKGFDEDKNSDVKSYEITYRYTNESSFNGNNWIAEYKNLYRKTITTDGGENRAREIFKIDYDFENIDLLEVRIV